MHLDISSVDVPPAGDRALAPIELLQQKQSIVDRQTMNSRVVDGDTALGYRLLEISQAQIIGQVPADAQQDYRAIEVTAFEHLNLRSWLEA
jgi:hypothetical protein